MSEECLFCKIVNKEIPSEQVFNNEKVIAFKDINPMAKEHYLFIHRTHTKNVSELMKNDCGQINDIFSAITEFTSSTDLEKNGFRVATNIGSDGCQSVMHTHFHVLGGEKLKAGFGT